MKYCRFEELPVWKDVIQLAVRVFALTAQPVFRRHPSIRNQIERASLSVSNNIAEGFERGTTNEPLHFLYIPVALAVRRVPCCGCAIFCLALRI